MTVGKVARWSGYAVVVAATAPLAVAGSLLGIAERTLGDRGSLEEILSRPLRWALRKNRTRRSDRTGCR